MINKNLLDELNKLGFGADVNALESYIDSLQNAASMGTPLVSEEAYEQHFNLLKELKPTSYILTRKWEIEDNELEEFDSVLASHGMKSLYTVQKMSDLYRFKGILGEQTTDLLASIKLNGHAVRAVYVEGNLRTGSTRGKDRKGKDITQHLKSVLPNYVPQWEKIKIVEVRAEIIMTLNNFELFKHVFKTPLSAATHLLSNKPTEEDIKTLDCFCYRVIPYNTEVMRFDSLSEEFRHLKEAGFKTPPEKLITDVTKYNIDEAIDKIIRYFEEQIDTGFINYSTNGIVVSINNLDQFYNMGVEDNYNLGNFALKMGPKWEKNIYSSKILDIIFEQGRDYLIPKAIIEPVITLTGESINNVPLYNVGIMEKLGLIPGNKVYFKFEGEEEPHTCLPNGELIGILGK